jgi:osmotically inducible protein OsmC
MDRKATAVWNGTGKDGNGHLTTQSNVLKQTPYSYQSRFEQGEGTNPEELIAAAHAGCFTMKLTFLLSEGGFIPETLETTAVVTLGDKGISHSHLILKGKVPGISAEQFASMAEKAKQTCPVSQALNTEITLEQQLVS